MDFFKRYFVSPSYNHMIFKGFVLVFVLFATANSLLAASFTWTGTADSLWSNASNWSGGVGYPDDASDDITINDNTIPDNIVLTENITINDVYWNDNRNDGFDLNDFDLTVSGDFLMSNSTRLRMVKSNGQLALNGDFTAGIGCTISAYDVALPSGTITLGKETSLTLANPNTKVALSLNNIVLADYCRLIFSMNSNLSINDISISSFDIIELPRGKTTTIAAVTDWDQADCTTYNTFRSFVPGTRASIRFTGGPSTGDGNVFEDIRILTNSGGNTFTANDHTDLGNNTSISGTTRAASTCEFDGNGDNVGNWNDASEWDCGCIPRVNDGVTIGAGKTVTIDSLRGQCDNLSFGSSTSRIDGGTDDVLEVYGNARIDNESSMEDFRGTVEFRSHDTGVPDTIECSACDTIRFYGKLLFEFPGKTWELHDFLSIEAPNDNQRGDLTVTRGTLDLNGNDVSIESDLNVGNSGTIAVGTESFTFSGAETATISISGNFDFYDLIIDRESVTDLVEIRTEVVVTNNLDLSNIGIIGYQNTRNDTLILADGATVTGGSNESHVNPFMVKIGNDDFTFPVGDGTYYRPIGVTDMAGNSTATDKISGEYFGSNPFDTNMVWTAWEGTINSVSTREYWHLFDISGSPTPKVTLSWLSPNPSGGVGNIIDLRVAHWTGAIFEDLGNGGTTGNTTEGTIASSDNASSFSPFALATNSSNNTLPIDLLAFNVFKGSDQNTLRWSTSTESNTSHYEVYKSSTEEARGFKLLGIEPAAGNSSVQQDYEYLDFELSEHAYYYVKSVDFDGFSQLTNVRYVSREDGRNMMLYPNPNSGEFRLSGLIGQSELRVYDLTGALVWTAASQSTEESLQAFRTNLAPGCYHLQVADQVLNFVVTR